MEVTVAVVFSDDLYESLQSEHNTQQQAGQALLSSPSLSMIQNSKFADEMLYNLVHISSHGHEGIECVEGRQEGCSWK